MNEHEIDRDASRYSNHPVLAEATRFLRDFKDAVNQNSDGWAYWHQPFRAAKKLMTFIQEAIKHERSGGYGPDCGIAPTVAALRKSLVPIKSFATRRNFPLPPLPTVV